MKFVKVKLTRDPVAAGMAALSCGNWAQARADFEAALGTEETAQALESSPATVKREWTAARAWLRRELTTA